MLQSNEGSLLVTWSRIKSAFKAKKKKKALSEAYPAAVSFLLKKVNGDLFYDDNLFILSVQGTMGRTLAKP